MDVNELVESILNKMSTTLGINRNKAIALFMSAAINYYYEYGPLYPMEDENLRDLRELDDYDYSRFLSHD